VNSYSATSFTWVPSSGTQASFDAIIFTHDRIVTIQVTVDGKHSMNPIGFEEMRQFPEEISKSSEMARSVMKT